MANEVNTEGEGSGGTGGTVMDAVNEALGLGGSDEQGTGADDAGASGDDGSIEAGDDTGVDGASGEADTGDKSGGDEAGSDEPKGEGAAATKGADESGVAPKYADVVKEASKLGIQQRHANGQIKSAAELQAELDAKKGGDGKQGDAVAAKKAADPLTDPIPKDVAQPTQERIRTLIKMTKDADDRATTATQNFDQFVGGLQSAGVTPEQYGETVSFLALFNSNDPKQQGQALDILEDMTDKLATLLGKERRSADPLERHADLIAAVQKREITPQYAREVARTRNQGAFRTEITTAARNSETAQQQAAQERSNAVTELNTLEQTLKASDALYERKLAIIKGPLKAAFQHMPPSRWSAAFKQAYAAAKVAPLPVRQKIPANQPMRAGKSPAGSGANSKTGGSGLSDGGPKSMLDAVNAALAGR